MIYDWTDTIFRWKGWHIFKWITGVIIISVLIYLIWNYHNGVDYNKIIKNFSSNVHL